MGAVVQGCVLDKVVWQARLVLGPGNGSAAAYTTRTRSNQGENRAMRRRGSLAAPPSALIHSCHLLRHGHIRQRDLVHTLLHHGYEEEGDGCGARRKASTNASTAGSRNTTLAIDSFVPFR
jgi:hypothetical protein